MTHYKLYYFNVTGLAEPIRFLLHYCGVKFEDIRFKDYKDWEDNYKKDMPMEQVPVLEIDGVKFHQHKSICRYIGKKFQLYGSNDEETFEIDAFIDDIEDLRMLISAFYKEEDVPRKGLLKTKALEAMPFYLTKLNSRIKENNDFLLNKISLADIYYSGICEILSNIVKQDLNENYPKLRKVYEFVRQDEKIKSYLDKRPETFL